MTDMTFDRAKELIESYGSDPARWPAGERRMAEKLVASSPELSALLRDQAALDRSLNAFDTLGPSIATPGLRDRVVAVGLTAVTGSRPEQKEPSKAMPGDPWQRAKDFFQNILSGVNFHEGLRPASIYAGAALLGLAIGMAAPVLNMSGNGSLSDDDIFEVAFASTDYMSPDGPTFQWEE